MQIKISNESNHPLPKYQTEGSAGMDLCANINEPVSMQPNERQLIPTGLSIEIPLGYEGQVRPRSGLAFKKGLTVLNAPGTIDSDYRGDIGVMLINLSNNVVEVNDGDRIAQLIIAKHESIEWLQADTLENSERGAGGFGSTGSN